MKLSTLMIILKEQEKVEFIVSLLQKGDPCLLGLKYPKHVQLVRA